MALAGLPGSTSGATMPMGVTVKYLEPAEVRGYKTEEHRKAAWTWDGHDHGHLRGAHDRSRRAAIGGHAVYSDRQNAFIEACLDDQGAMTEDEAKLMKRKSDPWSHCVRGDTQYQRPNKPYAKNGRKRA
jgi:hypothetical protein